MPKNPKKPAPEAARRSKTLVNRLKPKQTPQAASAELIADGLAMNAVTAVGYSKNFGELDLTECMAALVAETRRVRRGDFGGPEAMLAAQAITLNAMFTQLAYQSSKMTIVDQIDRFTRLALKAQGQCRATLETLAAIKNPPAVFARQANITSGPQQVNNGLCPRSRAGNLESTPNELLEGNNERLDARTTNETGESHQNLVPVEALNRSTKR